MRSNRVAISIVAIIVLFGAMYALNVASNRPKPPPDVQLEGRLAAGAQPKHGEGAQNAVEQAENAEAAENAVEPAEAAENAEEPAAKTEEPDKGEKASDKPKAEGKVKMSAEEKKLVADAKGSVVKIETDKGDIYLDLYDGKTPVTVGSFLELAGKGFYDGLKFHRVIPNFMIQGGDPQGTGAGGPGFTIPDEADKGIKHVRGSLSMAKTSAPNTGGSQFFICHSPQPHLDGIHTVFGECIKGMEVVDNIKQNDKMTKVTVLKESDLAAADIEKAKKARVKD